MATRTHRGQDPIKQSTPPPRHVAIIMDGNGRWARERGLRRLEGHRAGTDNIRRVVQTFTDHGIRYLTLYAFSTENWSRPKQEIWGLWRLLGRVISRERDELHKRGVRLLQIGRQDQIGSRVQMAIQEAIELTKYNTRLTLSVALDYGGRAEIIDAVKRMMEAGLKPGEVNEQSFSRHLDTAETPDPDLVIRTAGEMRLSNFLIWQTAYAEYYSTPVYWPDFDEGEITLALKTYSQRRRRFGGIGQEEPSGTVMGST